MRALERVDGALKPMVALVWSELRAALRARLHGIDLCQEVFLLHVISPIGGSSLFL